MFWLRRKKLVGSYARCELDQPVVLLDAVGLPNAVGPLVAEEVDVHAVARVRLQGVEEVARPGGVAGSPSGGRTAIDPDGVDNDVVRVRRQRWLKAVASS